MIILTTIRSSLNMADGFTVVPQPFTDKSFSSVAHLLTSHLRGLESPLLTQVNLNEIVASKIKHKNI